MNKVFVVPTATPSCICNSKLRLFEDLAAMNDSNDSNMTIAAGLCPDEETYEPDATIYNKVMGTLIFLIVWPFIVFDSKHFPIGRPAAALVGATFMVIFLVVPIGQVFFELGERGNLQTICLLIGMMLLSYYYDREGLLRIAALWIFGTKKPFKNVLWKVCVLSAVLSAIITNDATCLVITPLIVNEHQKQARSIKELPPLLLGIATSANIGSAATFFGNPQNAFIAAHSDGNVSLLTFFATSLPAAILGMVLSIAMLYGFYFRTIFARTPRPEATNPENEDHEDAADRPDLDARFSNGSIAASREDFARSHDMSENPNVSSQIAHERRKPYQDGALPGPVSYGVAKSQSSYSLPRNYKGAALDSTELSLRASSSHPNLYGATEYSSDFEGSEKVRRYIRSPRSSRSTRTTASTQRVTSPLRRVPEDRTISTEHYAIDDDEEQEIEEEEEVVVETADIRNRSWRSKVFIAWLLIITVVMVILLAIPEKQTNLEFNLGLVPLGISILTMLVDTIINKKYAYDAMTKIDWPVILLFFGLFVWLRGFQNTRFPNQAFNKIRDYMDLDKVYGVVLFTVFVVVGSNVLSNVPLVIVIVDQLDRFTCGSGTCEVRLTGVLLAWVSTIAGNFTLIGSVANLIVAEKARSCVGFRLTFVEYLKFGFFSTIIVLFAGLPIVYFAGDNIGF